jgi:hypothetical protein
MLADSSGSGVFVPLLRFVGGGLNKHYVLNKFPIHRGLCAGY